MAIFRFWVHLLVTALTIMADCPKNDVSGKSWKEGQFWMTSEMLLQCNNSRPTPVHCVKQFSHIPEFVKIGLMYDDGPLRKKCTEVGVHVISCLQFGRVVKEMTFVDKKNVLKRCFGNTVHPIGCELNGDRKQFGESFRVNGKRQLCSEHGLISSPTCLNKKGNKVDADTEFEDNGMIKVCGAEGIVTVKECIAKDGSRWELGQNKIKNEIQFNCTQNGIRNLGCVVGDGSANAPIATMFEKNGILYNCTADYVIVLGCTNGMNSKWTPVHATVTEFGVQRKCTEDGWISLGCLDNKGLLVNIGRHFVNGSFKKLCDTYAAVTVECATSTSTFMQLGTRSVEKGVELECTEYGLKPTGCLSSEGKRQIVGQQFSDDKWLYKCTEDEAVIVGCITSTGDERSLGEEFMESNTLMQCNNVTGIEPISCLIDGQFIPIDNNFEENNNSSSNCIRCTSTGPVVTGCLLPEGRNYSSTSHDYVQRLCIKHNAIPQGSEIISNERLKFTCTPEGLKTTQCLYKNDRYSIGEVFNGWPMWRVYMEKYSCARSGLELLGCVKFSMFIYDDRPNPEIFVPLGETKLIDGVYRQCRHNKHDTEIAMFDAVGCLYNGPRHPFGRRMYIDEVVDDGMLRKCTIDGMKIQGCIYKNTMIPRFEYHIDGEHLVKCDWENVKGPVVVGCIFGNQTYYIGQLFTLGYGEYTCTSDGVWSNV